MLYACICPLWDIASSARVPSPSDPWTSKHLRSSRMNNYRLSCHNLYTYLMWWAKDICSPEKQLKFQNWALKFQPSSWGFSTINPTPCCLRCPTGRKVVLVSLSQSSVTAVPSAVALPDVWQSHPATGHSHQHSAWQHLGCIPTLQEVFVKSAPVSIQKMPTFPTCERPQCPSKFMSTEWITVLPWFFFYFLNILIFNKSNQS